MIIEAKIKDYLSSKIPYPVHTETPKSVEAQYVQFSIIDRGREDYIDAVTVEFYSYGASMVDAATVDEDLRNAMFDFIEEPDISHVDLGGGEYEYDTTLKKHAYRSYFNIFY